MHKKKVYYYGVAGVAQSVVQLIRNQQVEGSSPFTSSKASRLFALRLSNRSMIGAVAQLGERSERRRGRKKRGKASGRDLPSGELQGNEDRGLVTTGRARGAHKNE